MSPKIYSMATAEKMPKEKTEPGSKTRYTYRWDIDEAGEKKLIVDEEIDQDAEIQSYLEETKIENIIQRASFDPSTWEKFGAYGNGETVDLTGMPGTLAEAQKLMIEVGQKWDRLPIEIKNKFHNDKDYFIHSFGSVEWANALGLIEKPVVTNNEPKEEVKEE